MHICLPCEQCLCAIYVQQSEENKIFFFVLHVLEAGSLFSLSMQIYFNRQHNCVYNSFKINCVSLSKRYANILINFNILYYQELDFSSIEYFEDYHYISPLSFSSYKPSHILFPDILKTLGLLFHYYKYNQFTLYKVTCMYVFSTDHLVSNN